jgi:anhydro-N-acetylmuramic acid kinase
MTLYIGLLSGTSIDAVDAALVDIDDGGHCTQRHYVELPYPPALASALHAARRQPSSLTLPALGRLDVEVGRVFAAAASELLRRSATAADAVTAIGSHGQTLYHRPGGDHPFTSQVGDPNIIAALTGITTVADFRRMDLALGGQGAPLAPAFHAGAFADAGSHRAIVNVGGIANVTLLPAGGAVSGFDTGPGNALMDDWAQQHLGTAYDADGAWARRGSVNERLLRSMLGDPYFQRPAPKSTGRETFNVEWLQAHLRTLPLPPPAEDVQATLLVLTAQTIALGLAQVPRPLSVYLCGGGARNGALMAAVGDQLPGCRVQTTAALGVEPEAVEAILFAWLAHRRLRGEPVDLRAVTGARAPALLGGIYAPR